MQGGSYQFIRGPSRIRHAYLSTSSKSESELQVLLSNPTRATTAKIQTVRGSPL